MNSVPNLIVIGSSAGGMEACKTVLSHMPQSVDAPICIVQHMAATMTDTIFPRFLQDFTSLAVKEAHHGDTIQPGAVYVAPADYHLLVESSCQLSLSKDEKQMYARPSIDILFETAADAFGSGLIGIILTGANSDGTQGMAEIQSHGGVTIAQDPKTAESPVMPASAIDEGVVDYILPLSDIGPAIDRLLKGGRP